MEKFNKKHFEAKSVEMKNSIDVIIQEIEVLTNEWKKLPNSRIVSEEDLYDETKVKNKYRAIYFTKLLAELGLFAEYLPEAEKNDLENELEVLSDRQRKFVIEDKVPEYIVDEMDNFAQKIVDRYKRNY